LANISWPTLLLLLLKCLHAVTLNVKCPRVADILLVLDQSRSIITADPSLDNWHLNVLGFAKGVVDGFPIDRNLTQVAVVKFSNDSKIVFFLNTYNNRTSVLSAIDNIDIDGSGQRNLAAALRAGRSMFNTSNGSRGGVPKLLVLLTDGVATLEANQTLEEANRTKEADIVIYTVGVGNDVDMDELRAIASKPEYFFFAHNFTDLNNVIPYLDENVCEEAAMLPTTGMQKF